MVDNYVFPCIFSYEDNVINVSFPDLPGCLTFGENEEKAFFNAKEALEGYLYLCELEKEKIPSPSSIPNLKTRDNEVVTLIKVWMEPVRDEMENKSVKKTLTIPRWINDLGIKHKINFSHLLSVSVKKYLDI